MVKAIKSDKNTTVAGIAGIVAAIAQVIYVINDGDPATVPDFQTVGLLILGWIGLVSADGGKNESTFKTNQSNLGDGRR